MQNTQAIKFAAGLGVLAARDEFEKEAVNPWASGKITSQQHFDALNKAYGGQMPRPQFRGIQIPEAAASSRPASLVPPKPPQAKVNVGGGWSQGPVGEAPDRMPGTPPDAAPSRMPGLPAEPAAPPKPAGGQNPYESINPALTAPPPRPAANKPVWNNPSWPMNGNPVTITPPAASSSSTPPKPAGMGVGSAGSAGKIPQAPPPKPPYRFATK